MIVNVELRWVVIVVGVGLAMTVESDALGVLVLSLVVGVYLIGGR